MAFLGTVIPRAARELTHPKALKKNSLKLQSDPSYRRDDTQPVIPRAARELTHPKALKKNSLKLQSDPSYRRDDTQPHRRDDTQPHRRDDTSTIVGMTCNHRDDINLHPEHSEGTKHKPL